MNPAARHNARHYALQALYQWQLTGSAIQEVETQYMETQIKKKTDTDYFKELINAVARRSIELDDHMQPFLKRPITELDPIELSVLRMGTYELAERLDIPYRVVLNEALDLTKKFGSVEGYKFVNGVLDQVAKKLRTVEINAEKK